MLKTHSIPTPLAEHHDAVVIMAASPAGRFPTMRITARLVWWVLGIGWRAVTRRGKPAEYGRSFRFLLEDLGGLWVKLGQLLSLRVDLFPPEFCRELSQLQVKALGFPTADAMRILEEDLGPIASLFDDFSDRPMAAASMGQVHLARLHGSGTRVAVKVQRPNLPQTFQHQMRIIRWIVRIVEQVRFRPNLRWDELVWELDQIMCEEMDCRFEASTTRRMRRALKAHNIAAPKVFYATKRVLVTEFIEGVLMADYIHALQTDPGRAASWRTDNNVNPRIVGRRVMLSLLRQILEDNLFHGDLHPGNVMLLRDSNVALIDFGSCSFTERQYLDHFRGTTRALAEGNDLKAADLTLLMCGPLPRVDLDRIRDQIVRLIHEWGVATRIPEMPYHRKSVAFLYNEIIRILFEHHCTMEWTLLRIRRAQETLDASLLYLTPTVDYSKIAARYFRAADRRAAAMTTADRTPARALSALGSALDMADRLEEFTLFRAITIRRQVQRFQAATNRGADLIASGVDRLALVGGVAIALVFATFLAQRFPRTWTYLLGDHTLGWFGAAPYLDGHAWGMVLVISTLAGIGLIKLRRQMRRYRMSEDEQVSVV